MKKTFLIVVASIIFATTYSQDFYIGLAIGEQCAVYSKTETKNIVRTNVLFAPQSVNLTFSTIFKNNLELETGIMYYIYPYSYSDLYKGKNTTENGEEYEASRKHTNWDKAYYAFSIPVHLGYKFKLANRFYANVYSGLNFDFYFQPKNGFDSQGDYLYYQTCLTRKFNILLSNKVSLQYFTKFNLGIGVYGAFNTGMFQVWESVRHLYLDYEQTGTYPITFLSRGSYWNFGIELGYKFSKKQKK